MHVTNNWISSLDFHSTSAYQNSTTIPINHRLFLFYRPCPLPPPLAVRVTQIVATSHVTKSQQHFTPRFPVFQRKGRESTLKHKFGGFLKWWYPTTMGFPTKNYHFGVFWGTPIFGNPHSYKWHEKRTPSWTKIIGIHATFKVWSKTTTKQKR